MEPHRHTRQLQIFFAIMALTLAACAQLGLSTPQTFAEKVVAAKATVAQVTTTAAMLLNARAISSEDGENVLRTVDAAAAGINTAQALAAQDPAGAQARLTATVSVLAAMQAYLATKKGST